MKSTSRYRPGAARRMLVVLGVVAALAAVLAPAAFAHPYTATISRTSAGTGDTDPYSYTITNRFSSSLKVSKAEITIPAGWSVTLADPPVVASGGKSWTASLSGNPATKIVLNAGSGGQIAYNEWVTVSFAARTCSPGTTSWTPKVWGGSTLFSLSGSMPKVTVSKPGRLHHFTWTQQPGAQQTAGVAFGAKATAYDSCNNVKTNYGGAATVGGDLNEAPDGTDPGYGVTWAQGVGTASATAFKAEDDRSLKVKDGTVEASSSLFDVAPGQLGSFTLAGIGDQVAGTFFGVTATAFDKWLNLKTNYAGGATVTGTLNAAPDGTDPVYGGFGAWQDGTATAEVTPFAKEAGRTVSVSDGLVSKLSNTFAVDHGPLSLAFTSGPALSEVNQPIKSDPTEAVAPVVVKAEDEWGNTPDDGTDITMSIAVNPSGGTLTGTLTRDTLAGSATFDDLELDKAGSAYKLLASLNPTATSAAFDVVDDLAVCEGSSCSGSATNENGQNADTSLTGQGQLTGEVLTTSFLADPLSAPRGACDGFTAIGEGVDINVQGGEPTQSRPTFTITFRVPAAFLTAWTAGWKYNLCLGTIPFEATGAWLTKTLDLSSLPLKRRPAVADVEGRYWGVVPSCAFANGEPLPWFPIPSTNPCIASKTRTGFLGLNGDLVIVLRKPYPWDGRAWFG